ncbi:hypothetical protein G3N58_16165 [Paraburkholderia sp. Ac-20342]|uniref:hypothetical protein n=1 Tax=Paraburkholderia sp. Ac-20342 TaxID=2703889 RepID=UPI00197FD5B7|nr:hypothetical protein [Paraburkholderia sp. Ac-20342]MBN3848353.1 hypothetical protein [Paraburkholderia sp. Ac-20342]
MKMAGVMLYLLGIIIGMTSFSLAYIYWVNSPVGLPCHSVGYDGTLEIENRFLGKEISFLNNGKSMLLAREAGRHRGPFPMTMFDGIPSGSPMHLEYCGPAVVRMNIGDREIIKRTQKEAEDSRKAGMLQWGRGVILGVLAVLLGRGLARRAPD